MHKILIDGRILTHKYITGVERYGIEITKGLKNAIPEKVDSAMPKLANRWTQHLWEHTALPFIASKYKVLFSPANICPMIKPQKTAFVTTIHDVSFLNYPDSFSFAYRNYYTIATKRIVRLSDLIITVSEFEKEELMERYGLNNEKIVSIYSGINKEFLNCNIDFKKENYILYVGNLSKRKNFAGLIRAFSKIYNKIDKKLVIVGMKPEIMKINEDINKIISSIPEEYIEFKGQINNISILRELYRRASLFIFPSLYESFGFPVLEAMACGCPVITSDKGALHEICSDAVLYIDPLDIDDICDKLILLNRDENVKNNCIIKGRKRAQLFLWETSIKKHRQLLESFL